LAEEFLRQGGGRSKTSYVMRKQEVKKERKQLLYLTGKEKGRTQLV
jgi:hypothetical protein